MFDFGFRESEVQKSGIGSFPEMRRPLTGKNNAIGFNGRYRRIFGEDAGGLGAAAKDRAALYPSKSPLNLGET